MRLLSERDRQLGSLHEIAEIVLSSLDLDRILDNLSRKIVEAGILRSVMLAVVDHENNAIEVVRSMRLNPADEFRRRDPDLRPGELAKYLREEPAVIGFRYDLDDDNITAVCAKTGKLRVLESHHDAMLDSRFDNNPEYWENEKKVAYFIPVKHGDRVVAVIATGSTAAEKQITLERIELMTPMLDLFAIALNNANLYRELQQSNEALRRHELELVRLERHRALGEMAAGISHNLNNILTGVVGPAQLLKQFSEDATVHKEADQIIKAGERAMDLVYRLYRSARGDTGDVQELVDVNSIVTEAIGSTQPRWKDEAESRGAPIEIETDLGDVPSAYVTASGLNDILINLIFNAIDAMEVGGTIRIETRESGEGVELTVRDTGHGMDEETRNRVFEPFFTTKMDVGTGLGLSTVYGTIDSWGGSIEIESAVSEGTAFRLWLPGGKSDGPIPVDTTRRIPVVSHSGKILIVDDDDTVGQFLLRSLSKDHQVEWVNNGGIALQRVARGGYDLAIIDLGMPGMPGDQLAPHLVRIDPTLATILITGWNLEEDSERRAPFDFYLQKPFRDLNLLHQAIQDAKALHDQRAAAASQ